MVRWLLKGTAKLLLSAQVNFRLLQKHLPLTYALWSVDEGEIYVCGSGGIGVELENKFGDLLRNAYFCLKESNYGTGFNLCSEGHRRHG